MQIKSLVLRAFNLFSQILSPLSCAYCHTYLITNTILCDSCFAQIKPVDVSVLRLNNDISMLIYAASNYEDPLKKLILAKHYSQRVASAQLGKLMWQYSGIHACTFDYIVPIPLHWRRYARRGYNQATVMAHEIARVSKKPIVNALKRSKATRFQSLLSADERYKNIESAFDVQVHNKGLHNKHLLLVDDLMTTGVTLQEAGKALLVLQPASITAVVACRVISQ